MRRRAIRDLGTLAGVLIILGGVVAANTYMRLDSLKEKWVKIRKAMEQHRREEGVQLLEWDMLHQVKGTFRSGPRYTPEVEAAADHAANIVGFMAPITQFRKVNEFMLLPMPIQCYFCEAPPMRDVIHIKLNENQQVDLVNEPVLVGGLFKLHPEQGEPFFYSLEQARWGEAVTDEDFSIQEVAEETRQHHLQEFGEMMDGEAADDTLYAPEEVPDAGKNLEEETPESAPDDAAQTPADETPKPS